MSSIGEIVEHLRLCSRNFGQNSPEINENFFFFWTVLQFLNMNRLGFVGFWKIIPVFA